MQAWSSFIFFLTSVSTLASAGETSRKHYLELLENSSQLIPLQGDHTKGEIEIVTDPQAMAAIEKETSREVGVVMRDKYWLWINDACIFPSGKKGVYGRILWVKSLEACPGVAVMPMTSEGKVILNCNFRHATRSWEIELPRGGVNAGEAPEAAAKRETIEETGMAIDNLILLGEIPPDSGLTNSIVPIYLAKVTSKQEAQPEDSEAIEEVLHLSVPEIKQAFLRGYYEHKIRGESKRIPFRDPFLAYAILLHDIRQSEDE